MPAVRAVEALVSSAFKTVNSEHDAELRECVLSVADSVLEQPVFHELRRSVLAHVQPSDLVANARRHDLPAALIEAVGASNLAALRVADELMTHIVVASFEYLTTLLRDLQHSTIDRAMTAVRAREQEDSLWYLSDRTIPWQVREATLARDRAEVFSIVVLSCVQSPVDERTLRIVIEAWIDSARSYLAWLTGLDGVTAAPGITPLDLNAIGQEHAKATARMTRDADMQKNQRKTN